MPGVLSRVRQAAKGKTAPESILTAIRHHVCMGAGFKRALTLPLFFAAYVPVSALVRPIVFPVVGTSSFQNDFADPRANGARTHLGVDIITAKMTPVVAAVDGTVTYAVYPQASWGYSISIRDTDGYQYRYLHLNNDTPGTDDGKGGEANAYASGIRRGAKVTKGQLIGWAGDSANAEATVSHLHFELRDPPTRADQSLRKPGRRSEA